MFVRKTKWPGGANNAVMISVNVDAEYYIRVFDPNLKVDDNNFLDMGKESIEIGLPRLLDILNRYNIKATFFVPGAIAEKYSDALITVAEAGHEIGCHGYEHEHMGALTPEEQYRAIQKGMEAIRKVCGNNPVGFRAPEGEITIDTLIAAKRLGLCYSSSLHADDVPYYTDLGEDRLLEIPIHWSLYDLPYFAFNFSPPIPAGQSRIACSDKVLNNWKWEYDGFHRYGSCYVLQIDPQCIGSQGKIYMLEGILDYILEKGNAWFATGYDIFNYYEKLESEDASAYVYNQVLAPNVEKR
ncbi:MAG: polysaccharide deacetylase [Lutispora sp.]|nr:polysaccharide deacetylase [Lutispora sp.]